MGGRVLVAAFVAAFLYFLTQSALAVLQAEFGRRTITAGERERIEVPAGAVRNVYLTPEESEPYNFDFSRATFAARRRRRTGTRSPARSWPTSTGWSTGGTTTGASGPSVRPRAEPTRSCAGTRWGAASTR